jgi:hypothetical protein
MLRVERSKVLVGSEAACVAVWTAFTFCALCCNSARFSIRSEELKLPLTEAVCPEADPPDEEEPDPELEPEEELELEAVVSVWLMLMS